MILDNFICNLFLCHIQGTEMEIPGIYITGHPPTPPEQVYLAGYISCFIFFILAGVLQYYLKKKFLTPVLDGEGNSIPVGNLRLKTIAIIITVVFFFFFGVETTMQVYVGRNPHQIFIPDPTSHWKINPAIQRKYDKNEPTHQMDGLLDFEYNRHKEPGAYRILIFGDSQTMGTPWVPNLFLTYSKLLQKKLREEFPDKKIEVINMGVSGYSSYQGLLFFKNIGMLYNPDCIIVGLGYHDAGLSMAEDREITSDKPWIKSLRSLLYRSQIYLLIRKRVLENKREQGEYKDAPVRRVSKDDYYANLQNFADIGNKNNLKIIFLTVPQAGPDGCFHPEYTEIMRKAAGDFNVMLVDGVEEMKKIPDHEKTDYYVEDKVHFNQKGNDLMAQILFEKVKNIFHEINKNGESN